MERNDVLLLAQLMEVMKELSVRLKKHYEKKELDKFNSIKREMFEIQKRIASIIK
jgi:hypothetical protein